jgi:hypothetical protein
MCYLFLSWNNGAARSGAEDHYSHKAGEFGCPGVDLWRTDAPARWPDYNGTFSADMYNAEIQKMVAGLSPSTPAFLYIALQDMQCVRRSMRLRLRGVRLG